MVEDSPNRFVWHEGEVEGESEEDEIPREWPAYRRASEGASISVGFVFCVCMGCGCQEVRGESLPLYIRGC